MEYTLIKNKIKTKIVCTLLLLSTCLLLMTANTVSAESLFKDLDFSKVLVKTDVIGEVQILGQNENIKVTSKETKNGNNLLYAENLELEELEDVYVVIGDIEANLISSDISGLLNIKYTFDKKTKELIKSEVELSNQLDDTIHQTIAKEISSNSSLSDTQTNDIVVVNTESTAEIIPTDTEFNKTLENELKNKLNILSNIEIDDELKEVFVGKDKYILGSTKYTKNEEDTSKNKSLDKTTILSDSIIEDDVLYQVIGSETSRTVYGISGEKSKIKYLSEAEIISKLGEPMIIGKSKYWNISVNGEEINIVITDSTIDVLYKIV